jgi:outer membrane protein assembly factor BamB
MQRGTLRWKFKTDGLVISSPTIKNGIVYIGSADHNVYALPA